MTSEHKRSGWRTWGNGIAVLVVLALVYVLSYAPVVRYCVPPPVRGFEEPPVITVSFYRPVEWLIDFTPARTPLLWWADLWGVWHPTYSFSVWREIERKIEREQHE